MQKYLDLDQVLAVCTAPGHSYRNPAEKINCLLNIGLYGIGCMHQHSTDPFIEQSLSKCTGLGDVCKLIEKNNDRNTKFLKECCQMCINLISETFLQLKLKDEQFKVYEPSTHKEINKLFTECWSGRNFTTKQYDDQIFTMPRTDSMFKSLCSGKNIFYVSKEVWQPRLYYL